MESGLYDLSGYDALQLRVRGDGRRFIANLSAPSIGRKDDIWQAFVFTRGGPEWENVTLPFWEFVLTNYGYMQDRPTLLPLASVSTVGLLLADKVMGPFELELQSIRAVRRMSTRRERSM
jgi:NADH dehydrogenase [ubiquinone] 1 alpha subcomplex assembly factor 1